MGIPAFIFARGGSKGLPGKNIRKLGSKPLIAWAIEQALAAKGIDRAIVSTDSYEIAEIAKKYGAEVPFIRPLELSQDNSPEWLAWRHAINYYYENTGGYPKAMVSVPTTSPLRLSTDIEKCIEEFDKGGVDTVIAVTDSHRSPYFNMVKQNADGTVGLVNPPQTYLIRRQDAPLVYDITTVCYVINPAFLMKHNSIFEGRLKAVYVPPERAIDIDTLLDFQIAEGLLTMRL